MHDPDTTITRGITHETIRMAARELMPLCGMRNRGIAGCHICVSEDLTACVECPYGEGQYKRVTEILGKYFGDKNA